MVCCLTEQQASGVRDRLEGWLAGRGLSLNQDLEAMCPGSARNDTRAVPPDPSEVVTSAVATVRSSSLTSTR